MLSHVLSHVVLGPLSDVTHLTKCKTGVEIKADFKIPKAFSIVLSYFHSLNNKLVEFINSLIILEKSLIIKLELRDYAKSKI